MTLSNNRSHAGVDQAGDKLTVLAVALRIIFDFFCSFKAAAAAILAANSARVSAEHSEHFDKCFWTRPGDDQAFSSPHLRHFQHPFDFPDGSTISMCP